MTIRTKYLAALGLIAILVVSSSLIMRIVFEQQKNDAEIINIAGQQRMLSQRIALYINRLAVETSQSNRDALLKSVEQFTENHQFLVSLEKLPADVNDMYFGQMELDQRVKSYIDQSTTFLGTSPSNVIPDSFTAAQTDAILVDLNQVVKAFELDANQRVESVENIEFFIVMFTLFVLMVEALFIFRPLEKEIDDKIDKLKKARDDAMEAERVAIQANQAKSEFLASMSHELRTPMNGMFGMMELALDNPDKAVSYLEKAKSAGKQLLTLINDLLDFSKIEAGKVSIEKTSFDLIQVIDDVVSVQEAHCRSKGLRFVFEKTTSIPKQIIGDATRITQVLHNLLNNAVKFTESGSITLRVAARFQQKQLRLSFDVMDTGIGIPQDKLSDIFNKFSQADQSTTRRFGGTGLGLSISKHLVELMGGAIDVKSEEGKGSVFSIAFPVLIDQNNTSADIKESGLHAAIVDDLETSCEYLSHILSSIGIASTSFQSPSDFIEDKTTFDMVLLDNAMPEMDGVAVLHELAKKYNGKPPHVIFVTASPELLNIPKPLAPFVWQIHSKPIQRPELEHDLITLKTMIGDQQEVSEENTNAINILVAEDNEINAEIVRTMLEQDGHNVTIASDGEKAVNACTHHTFDLIFMDMNMPNMDGIAATSIIRQTLLVKTPIIALTANAYAEDKERCRAAGMDGFLSKPIDKHALLKCTTDIG